MNWPTAFLIVGGIAAYFWGVSLLNNSSDRKEEAMAVACLQSGGNWAQPSWYGAKQCLRGVAP